MEKDFLSDLFWNMDSTVNKVNGGMGKATDSDNQLHLLQSLEGVQYIEKF